MQILLGLSLPDNESFADVLEGLRDDLTTAQMKVFPSNLQLEDPEPVCWFQFSHQAHLDHPDLTDSFRSLLRTPLALTSRAIASLGQLPARSSPSAPNRSSVKGPMRRSVTAVHMYTEAHQKNRMRSLLYLLYSSPSLADLSPGHLAWQPIPHKDKTLSADHVQHAILLMTRHDEWTYQMITHHLPAPSLPTSAIRTPIPRYDNLRLYDQLMAIQVRTKLAPDKESIRVRLFSFVGTHWENPDHVQFFPNPRVATQAANLANGIIAWFCNQHPTLATEEIVKTLFPSYMIDDAANDTWNRRQFRVVQHSIDNLFDHAITADSTHATIYVMNLNLLTPNANNPPASSASSTDDPTFISQTSLPTVAQQALAREAGIADPSSAALNPRVSFQPQHELRVYHPPSQSAVSSLASSRSRATTGSTRKHLAAEQDRTEALTLANADQAAMIQALQAQLAAAGLSDSPLSCQPSSPTQ
jgi:hypothetical protein